MSGYHFVENCSQTPQVCARICICALSLFRRHVIGGSHHGAGASVDHCFSWRLGVSSRTLWLGQLGEAKTEKLNVAVAPDHDVLGVDVAMDDARGMRGCKRAADLNRDLENPCQLHSSGNALA